MRPPASFRSVIALGFLIILAIQLTTAYEIWRQYSTTIALAERNLNILADVLADEIRRTLVSVDVVMESVAQDMNLTTKTLRDRALGIAAIHSMAVVDGDGQLRAALHAHTQRQQHFLDELRKAPVSTTASFHVGPAMPSPFDGSLVFPFSHLRQDGTGNAAGLIVATLSIRYVQDVFLHVRSLPSATLTLARNDGLVLVQTPEGTLASMNAMPEFNPDAADSGLLHGDGDDGARIVAYRRLHPYGLKLSVALNSTDLLGLWRSNALRLLLAAMATSILLAAMIALMMRHRFRDESHRTRLRESERSRKMAQFSLDGSADLVVWTDEDGRIIYANRAAHEYLGHAPGTLLGVSVASIATALPQADWNSHMAALCKSGQMRFEADLRDVHGDLVPVEVSVAPLRYDRRIYTCAIARDIRARKRTEAALELRSRQLEASNAELEQFAYVVSHDLREPLRTVSSFVGLLGKNLDGQLTEQTREYLKFARDGAQRLDRMILDMLEYSRVGAATRRLVPLPLGRVILQASHALSLSLTESGGRLIVPDTVPAVLGDEDCLVRLLCNLIGNALKYRHPDRPPLVELSVQRQGDHVTCAIKDNGIGIAPQYFDRVFRLFQRLHGRGQYDGTGIGLAICKKIVEQHGGRIWIASVPDQGTTLFFTLTAAPTA